MVSANSTEMNVCTNINISRFGLYTETNIYATIIGSYWANKFIWPLIDINFHIAQNEKPHTQAHEMRFSSKYVCFCPFSSTHLFTRVKSRHTHSIQSLTKREIQIYSVHKQSKCKQRFVTKIMKIYEWDLMKRNRAHSVEEATHKKLKQLVFCLYLYSEHTYITQIHECSGFGMIRGVASVFARKCFSIDLSNVNNNLHPTNTHTHTRIHRALTKAHRVPHSA